MNIVYNIQNKFTNKMPVVIHRVNSAHGLNSVTVVDSFIYSNKALGVNVAAAQ